MPSEESAVHWRHSTAAKVIVFAPSDAEREGIGAGLGPMARIDSQAIVDRTSAWLQTLDETHAAEIYMRAMLGRSAEFADLYRFGNVGRFHSRDKRPGVRLSTAILGYKTRRQRSRFRETGLPNCRHSNPTVIQRRGRRTFILRSRPRDPKWASMQDL